jgi:hypothetical protein
LAAACDNDPADLLLPDTYIAVAANENTLPAMLITYPAGDGIRMVAGSLTLRAPDSAFVVLRTQYVSPTGVADAPVTDTTRAQYQAQGTTLQFTQSESFTLHLESGELLRPRELRIVGSLRLPPSHGLGSSPVRLFFVR